MPISFTCPHCQQSTVVDDQYAGMTGPCSNCNLRITIPDPNSPFGAGVHTGPVAYDMGQDAGVRMLLPVGRTALSVIAGYLGLFAVLIVPAPLALIVGIMAIRGIRRKPGAHGMGRAIFGTVMGGIFTLVAIAVLLAAWAG